MVRTVGEAIRGRSDDDGGPLLQPIADSAIGSGTSVEVAEVTRSRCRRSVASDVITVFRERRPHTNPELPDYARASLRDHGMSRDDALTVRLDTPLPARLTIGKGQVLAPDRPRYHPVRDLRRLSIMVDGVDHVVPQSLALRSDVPPTIRRSATPRRSFDERVAGRPSRWFGRACRPWWSCMAPTRRRSIAPLRWDACGLRGRWASSSPPPSATEPQVTVCMAAYNLEFRFAEQVASIRAQTHRTGAAS